MVQQAPQVRRVTPVTPALLVPQVLLVPPALTVLMAP
jgi:hypothetical protein